MNERTEARLYYRLFSDGYVYINAIVGTIALAFGVNFARTAGALLTSTGWRVIRETAPPWFWSLLFIALGLSLITSAFVGRYKVRGIVTALSGIIWLCVCLAAYAGDPISSLWIISGLLSFWMLWSGALQLLEIGRLRERGEL